MAIDPNDARPLSVQITDDLRQRIVADEFPVGAKFPSLRALASAYKVAELTVHAAVKQLQSEGVLVSTSGRGTFIRAKPSADPEDGTALAGLAALRDEVAEIRARVEALEQAQRGG